MLHHGADHRANHSQPNQTTKKKERILVVDQDALTCDFLANIIKLLGCEFEIINSADEALEILEKTAFDLLIADFHLPNSKQLLETSLQKHPQLQTICMIQHRQIFFEALRLPGAAFVPKPFNFDDIVQKIHQAIHHKNLQQIENDFRRLRQEFFRL
ncbi:response regulator [Desulfobacca acetoxidans]